MSDRYGEGYRAAMHFYAARDDAARRAGDQWASPERTRLVTLIRTHWPELAYQLDWMTIEHPSDVRQNENDSQEEAK